MKKRYLFSFEKSLIFFLILILTSCSKEELPFDNNFKNSIEENEDIKIELAIDLPSDLLTRCLSLNETDCSHNGFMGYFSMLIKINDKLEAYFPNLIERDEIAFSYRSDNLNNPYLRSVKDIKYENNKITLSLTFNKKIDPSNIELSLVAGPNYISRLIVQTFNFQNVSENTDKTYLFYNESALGNPSACTFYERCKLNNVNDWRTIIKRIELKRLNSEIYILIPHEKLGIDKIISCYEESNWNLSTDYYAFISSSLNCTSSITSLLDTTGKLSPIYYGSLESDISYYYIDDDISYVKQGFSKYTMRYNILTEYLYAETFFSKKIKYKDKEYFMIPLRVFASVNKKYPRVINERIAELNEMSMKYITLFLRETRNPKNSTTWTDFNHYHWNSFPLPEGGIERNKNYLYILSEDFPLWENEWRAGKVPETSIIETRSTDNLDIIELDYDLPLPFELIEEE